MGWGGWGGGHVNVPCSANIRCCYAAEISGFVATLQVATLQRSQTPKNTQIWTSKFPTFRVTTMVASLRQNTHFFVKLYFHEHGFRSAGIFMSVKCDNVI